MSAKKDGTSMLWDAVLEEEEEDEEDSKAGDLQIGSIMQLTEKVSRKKKHPIGFSLPTEDNESPHNNRSPRKGSS